MFCHLAQSTAREREKMTEPATDLSTSEPIGYRRWSEEWWENRGTGVKERRCTSHRKNGDQCRNPAILGATVCRYHGGAAKQVVHAARVRLQNAADKMARELLGMATDPNVSDSVKITAIRDALDRAGLKPVTAVDLDISTRPWEKVFEGIAKVVAGPRDPQTPHALANESESATHESGEDDEIVGEFDDDVIEDDPYLPRVEPQRERESSEIIDVEIDTGYTDQIMSDDPTPTRPRRFVSERAPSAPGIGPLGLGGPAGSGLMSLSDAVEAAAEMRARQAARDARHETQIGEQDLNLPGIVR